MISTLEDIEKAIADVDIINQQIRELEARRNENLVRIDVMDNERALFGVADERDAEAFRTRMLNLTDEQITKKNRENLLSQWVRTIDPALAFRGWGIDNERNELFPDFILDVPEIITDDFVRNVNFFARIVSPVQPGRLRINNRSFRVGYEGTFLKFSGEQCENGFTVCGSFRSGTSETLPLLAVLRSISVRAFNP